ncbi:MAG: hypothetical protein D6689_16195 [Deltaproteobacteria bacterium]|nr:MAG: hypothetical protein D6689_16195 [Deltaproteobacteria bacterium]
MVRLTSFILALVAPLATARAGVFELDAQIHTGGMYGKGIAGDRKAEAFHQGARGFTYGAKVGVEVLFIDGWIEHNQFYDGDRVDGTWTQFMLGFDVKFDMGDKVGAKPRGDDDRFSRGFGELGIAAGFGVGTGQQVEPPLDNAQVTDKGFVAQAHLDFGYRLSRTVSVGLHLPFQVGWLLRSEPAPMGPDPTANEPSNWYGSVQASALVTLRMNFSLTN